MNVKGGTQTWSKAEQVSALKTDNVQAMSPQEMEKALGGQSLGEVLNKAADPNWVDPVKTRKVGNNQLDKDAFFKLMLTQMKYQDPTNPMQSHEMAAQLAQFSSLEQLNNINQSIEGLKTQQAPQGNYQALNFIGKRVWGDSSKIARTKGDTYHDIGFNLKNDAAEVKITIKDADGNPVKSVTAKNLKKGPNAISWNGLSEDGNATRPGDYNVVVEAKATDGAKVLSQTEFEGRITGLNFTPQGPILMVGNQSVRMQDVKKISEVNSAGEMPSLAQAMLQTQVPGQAPGVAPSMNAMPAPAAQVKSNSKEDVPAASDDGPKPTVMNDVAMSRALYDQVSKDTSGGQ